MKKVLTVLLAIAVMFTFSFGSAFAATTYTDEDYKAKLDTEKENLIKYLDNAKEQAVKSYDYNDEKFAALTADTPTADGEIRGYQEAAFAAAADAVIDAAEEAIDDAINAKLAEVYPKDTAPVNNYLEGSVDITLIEGEPSVALADLLTKAGMVAALEMMTEELNKAQLNDTKNAILEKTKIDLSKYNSEDKDYSKDEPVEGTQYVGSVHDDATAGDIENLTAVEAVEAVIADLKAALSDIDALKKTSDDEDLNGTKLAEYEAAYAQFDAELGNIKTLDDEAFDKVTEGTTVSTLVDLYATRAYGYLPVLAGLFPDSDSTYSFKDNCTNDKIWKEFWEGKTKTSKDGELFGVAIANYEKVTRSEGIAVYNAMKKAIDDSKKVVEAYLNATKGNSVDSLVVDFVPDDEKSNAKFYGTLKMAMDAADAYADVVKFGEKLKARYDWGVKQYDDAKVDAAVKKAEELVYADLDASEYGTPAYYIQLAAQKIEDNDKSYDVNLKLEEAKYAYTKFKEAVEDAAEKMYKNGTDALGTDEGGAATAATKKVSYGADKTADADLVYLLGTYYTVSGDYDQTEDWNEIAQDTLEALLDAQSYDEIDSIMKKAAEDFGKLLKDDDFADVDKAIRAYKEALDGFIAQTYGLLDDKNDYKKAFDGGVFTELKAKGAELLDAATTVEGVKAAYAEAQALVTGAKSDDELKDMKKAVEKKIKDLPSESKLTVADRDAVKEAYAAYAEYISLAGATNISNADTLKKAYDKVNALLAEEIDDAAEALLEKMEEVDSQSDADLPKYIALKEEAKALIAKGDALQDDLDAVEDDGIEGFALTGVTQDEDYQKIKAALGLNLYLVNSDEGNADVEDNYGEFYNAEILNAKTLLIKATKPGATGADMQAALDAYNALTQRQQYELDGDTGYYLELVKVISEKLGGNVKELKITAKSTAKKGSITVKWTVKGDADVDGFEIWKSTKHSKGYKKAFTTTKQTYKNSKGLKKGTRYYYKVRAYKMVDGVKITSDWSNKARRVAK